MVGRSGMSVSRAMTCLSPRQTVDQLVNQPCRGSKVAWTNVAVKSLGNMGCSRSHRVEPRPGCPLPPDQLSTVWRRGSRVEPRGGRERRAQGSLSPAVTEATCRRRRAVGAVPHPPGPGAACAPSRPRRPGRVPAAVRSLRVRTAADRRSRMVRGVLPGQILTSPSPVGWKSPSMSRSRAKHQSTGSSVSVWKARWTAYGSSVR